MMASARVLLWMNPQLGGVNVTAPASVMLMISGVATDGDVLPFTVLSVDKSAMVSDRMLVVFGVSSIRAAPDPGHGPVPF